MSNKARAKDQLTVIMATASVLLLSVVIVLVVRAYLTAKSQEKTNEFAPMTYTDTEILEQQTVFELEDGKTQISKKATISNPPSDQKKPVFVRVAVVCSVYDSTEKINMSYKYNCTAAFSTAANWTKIGDYYYYNGIIDPGEATTELFGSDVTINGVQNLPDDYKVHIDVIADTVQAVVTDSFNWQTEGYKTNEVLKAWTDVKPTLSGEGNKTVTWAAN